MDKEQAILISMQVIMVITGCVLIGDVKVIFGMILIIWADNFNNVRKAKIDARNSDIGKE